MHKVVSESELPNLCKPRRDNYIRVEKIPILGTDKLDIMSLKTIALKAKT